MDSESESKIISFITEIFSINDSTDSDWESKIISLMIQVISLVSSMDLESQPKPKSKLMSLVAQAVSVFKSMDVNSQPGPLSEIISLIAKKISQLNSTDTASEAKPDSSFLSLYYETFKLEPRPELISIIQQIVSLVISTDVGFTSLVAEPLRLESDELKLVSLISQLVSLKDIMKSDPKSDWDSRFISLVTQIISLVSSMDLESQLKPESKIMSLVAQAISIFNSMDLELIPLISSKSNSEFMSLILKTRSLEPERELMSIIDQTLSLFVSKESETEMELMSLVAETWRLKSDDLDPESKLMSLLSQLMSLTTLVEEISPESESNPLVWTPKLLSWISVIRQLISLVSSLDLDSQPEPHAKAISLVIQIMSVANSISDSEPEWEFISLMTQIIPLIRSTGLEQMLSMQDMLLLNNVGPSLYSLDDDSELYSLVGQLLDLTNSTDPDTEAEWELGQLISLSPQLKVELLQGKFQVTRKVQRKSEERGECQPQNRRKVYLARGEDPSHFLCKDCNGEDHEECEKTRVEVTHPLHPKHSLMLVSQKSSLIRTRKCFCCDEDLQKFFYYCSPCDYAMNIACVDRPPVLSIYHPKWHEHTLHWFPRRAFLTCNVCALADASSPIYMCPSCDFVVHLRCINLPRVIRISRHPHRISFTPSFYQGDWSCGVCRKGIDNDYGSYSYIKDGCSYAAHSRCATQPNVWDGVELEGEPEDIEEEVLEPFLQISDGFIQHFSHPHHHLRLDKNTTRDYDDNKQCQACITPIYFGDFYSCMHCDFILHEECAKLSRKIHHPIHPHMLTLVEKFDGVAKYGDKCSACPWWCLAGFFYKCCQEGCSFKLHVQCATVSEPLVQESHMHPLFLTSKPEEQRACSVCKDARLEFTNETFNCIEECNFSLCFKCATLPQKVRYKHDKHTLTLSYGKETSITTYWCEACEKKINPHERFYECDEYCCVTLHIECLIGKDLYMKQDSCFNIDGRKVYVLTNNLMSRPLCLGCRRRCPYNIVVKTTSVKFCSMACLDK